MSAAVKKTVYKEILRAITRLKLPKDDFKITVSPMEIKYKPNGNTIYYCYHDYLPFVPGASVRTYTDAQLERMMLEENTPESYFGKEYTAYEAKQRQRQLETTMRAQRQKIDLLKSGGAAENDIIDATVRYRTTSQEYTQFSKAMKIPQQRERVTVDGLGGIGKGKYTKGWVASDFNPKRLQKHLNDHLGEYPGFTADEYVNQARNLLNSPVSGAVEGFTSTKGFVFRYNNVNNDFATGKPNGTIETLFKPERGREYWVDQIEKYGKKGESQ